MKSLPSFFFLLLLITPSFAQRQVIVSPNSPGWAYHRALSDNSIQFKPEEADPDFWTTWIDHSFGSYSSPLTYDGPSFTLNQQAPFSAGNVPGITGGTSLDLPADVEWQFGYFLKVVDGGTTGYQNLNLKVLARDGAVVYLNGEYLGATPTLFNRQGENPTIYREGDGTTFLDLNLAPSIHKFLHPGPNLLAVVAGHANSQNEDFGVKIELSGEPGIPLITPITKTTIGNRIHLRWSTSVPQKTLVKITPFADANLAEIYESDNVTRNHYFTHEIPYTNFQSGNGYSYGILKPNLELWQGDFVDGFYASETFTGPGYETKTLFTHQDNDWHYLQVRDANGDDIDPALADPDYHQSWFRQVPSGFGTPPFDPYPYDGPAFTQATTPIHYGAAADFQNPGTTLTPPSGGEGHTLWLYRIIDGGSSGYQDSSLSMHLRGEASVFLNGELLHQTDRNAPSDTWPFPADDWQFTRTKEFRSQSGHINPGPNLLAVAVHNGESNLSKIGFSAELTAVSQPLYEIRSLEEELLGNTFSINYLTGMALPTNIRIGPTDGDLVTYEILGDRIFHQLQVSDLEENTPYSYEIEVPTFNPLPWESPTTTRRGEFTPTSTTFINHSSSSWHVLNPLDNNNLGTDPSLNDPDFNSTWMTLGMAGNSYDGPAFTPNQSSPFHISGIESGIGGSYLAHPGQNHSGAIYLVKEIAAPEKGAWTLDFNLTTPRAHQIYLNGELIIDDLGLNKPNRSWDLYWQHQERRSTQKPAYLLPGTNILAISLHPQNQNTPDLDFDLTLTGLTSIEDRGQMSPFGPPTSNDTTTTIQWFTDTASSTSLRYGPSRDSLTNLISLPNPSFFHSIDLPNPSAGQRIYYEILQPDGTSYHPPSINSFVTGSKTLIPYASQWSHLFPKSPETGESIDPALLDPDFYETWSTQSFGSYPGNPSYDGPTFSPLLPAPFGPDNAFFSSNTVTPSAGPVWFLKEIDGGLTGYHQLKFSPLNRIPFTAFLNGKKIGDTLNLDNSQAIWAQRAGSSIYSSIYPPSNLVLPPGPNLLAIQLHSPKYTNHYNFDLELTGVALENTPTTPLALLTTATSLELAWSTSTPQATRLRWGLSPTSLDSLSEIPGDRTYHNDTLPNLTPATTYYVEVLDDDGSPFDPPVLSSFLTGDHIILSRQSSDWSLLENVIDGVFADPALSDPDFLTTWHTPSSYDGPAFLPNQSAPFVSRGHLRVGQTNLQTIDQRIRPVWLHKEIDGGETGYQSLTLNANYERGFSVFLNGELIVSPGIENPTFPHGSWNFAATSNSTDNTNFTYELPESVSLPPGPSTLAISLHPSRLDIYAYLTGEFELTGVPSGLQLSPPVVTHLAGTQVELSWLSSELTSYSISYGLNPTSPDHLIENDAHNSDHLATLSNLTEGGTYTYEIQATTQSGETSLTVGTFEILPQLMRQPFLQKASPSSMTLSWRTRDPLSQFVVYGTDPATLDLAMSATTNPTPFTFSLAPDEIITDQTVTLTGLAPATKYYYQTASSNSPAPAATLDQFFTTPPPQGTSAPTRIWVVGDSGYARQGVKDVKDAYLQYTAETPTDLWLMLGDNAYGSGTDSQYQISLFNIFPELVRNTPIWPTMGNHDGYSNHYYDIFDLPTNGESGGVPSGTEKYYSFDHGNIHFICLNSEEDPDGMLEWLKADLQSTRSDWIIAFFHHGPYTKGSHDSDSEIEHRSPRQNYLPILEDYGVDLVLSGHSHQYERSHLLDGHYSFSSTYNADAHALDLGPGSAFGATSRETGLFQYTNAHSPYQKTIATPNSGQISTTVGASSVISSWSDTDGNRQAITHPNPHPVHVATIRALGSMVIDIDGHTLHASYLDSDGQTRDHFQINKVPEESPAIDWWQDHFGPSSYPYFADWFSDPDHDTHDNHSEFVLGGDPHQNQSLIEATIKKEEIGAEEFTEWFSIEYDLREGSDVTIETSENLIHFSTSGIETLRLTEPNAQGISRWESRVSRQNQRTLFFRLEVSR